jgi:hypothetical protein
MRIACWVPKATNTHSEYVILIAFPLQQWLHERALMLRYMFIACLFFFVPTETKLDVLLMTKKKGWPGYVASVRGRRCTYRLLAVKSERRPLRIPTRRWDDNIKVDLKYFFWEDLDWI